MEGTEGIPEAVDTAPAPGTAHRLSEVDKAEVPDTEDTARKLLVVDTAGNPSAYNEGHMRLGCTVDTDRTSGQEGTTAGRYRQRQASPELGNTPDWFDTHHAELRPCTLGTSNACR